MKTYPLKVFMAGSSWVIAFLLLNAIIYEKEKGLFYEEESLLLANKYTLEKQKDEAQKLHDRLLREVNSQSDSYWVEMTLIKGLGLIPEGHTKVLFLQPKQGSAS